VITRDLREALARAVAAEGFAEIADPGLRPTGTPGKYAASVALVLGPSPRQAAQRLAATLQEASWVKTAEVTGPGYLTIAVTREALAAVADRITEAGPACVTSTALAGVTVPAPPPGDPLAAATWESARAALAAQLTAWLAAAAGATVAEVRAEERSRIAPPARPPSSHLAVRPAVAPPASSALSPLSSAEPAEAAPPHESAVTSPAGESVTGFVPGGARPGTRGDSTSSNWPSVVSRNRSSDSVREPRTTGQRPDTDVAQAVAGGYRESSPRQAAAFAGRDAVTFTLARAIPGKPLLVDPRLIARRVPGNPAYAVTYAHARAASGVRWAATSSAAVTPGTGAAPPSLPADPGELALLDALSWLPERVAVAARRGRPDEFARYLEDLASVTVDVLSSASHRGNTAAPGSGRLTLARAARTGLGAGLGLLGVSAPDRL